jgi:hypothetical protein
MEIFNLKDPMRLMQKTDLYPLQIGMRLQMNLKSVGYMDTVLFLTIGNCTVAGYLSQKRLGKSVANFGNYWSLG